MTTTRTWVAPLLLAAGLVALSSGCGSDPGQGTNGAATSQGSDSTAASEKHACGSMFEERLDPSYLVHVVGDGEDVEYTTDPPTSGPHKAGPPMQGVVDKPLSRPVQVGILERGDVLIQHRADLPVAQQERLATLAGPGVVIAPNLDLPAPVVATAWTYKQTCETVDLGALQGFIDARRGKGPDD